MVRQPKRGDRRPAYSVRNRLKIVICFAQGSVTLVQQARVIRARFRGRLETARIVLVATPG